jgi:hypothetical protein
MSEVKYDYDEFVDRLSSLVADLPEEPPHLDEIRRGKTKKIREGLASTLIRLRKLAGDLDKVKEPETIFDPSDPKRVGEMIVGTLLLKDRVPLGSVQPFYGSGVYALYYKGPFDAYQPISGTNHPIYVGKADPKTAHAQTSQEQGRKLSDRLREHARTIASASETISLDHFSCRFLVVTSGFQRAAEDHLIAMYKPLWNQSICYGFGKHGDSPSTRGNTRSPWFELHPGKEWAKGSKPGKSLEEIKVDISEHFCQFPPRKG